jgi:hypothetical protein
MWFDSRQVQQIYLFTKEISPNLEPTQPHIQCMPATMFPYIKRPGVKLTTHLHLVPRLRMTGATAPLLHALSCVARGQLYVFTEREFDSYSVSKEFPGSCKQNPKFPYCIGL